MYRKLFILATLIALPIFSFAQYFQRFQDCDSTYNWGWSIFLRPDSTYFAFGWGINDFTNQGLIYNSIISGDGSSVLSVHTLQIESTAIGQGNPGQVSLMAGSYYMPATLQVARDTFLTSRSCLIKFNALGDTTILNTYTDTSRFFDNQITSTIVNANNILLGGGRAPYGMPEQGLLIRTDSLGDTMWTKTYPSISGDLAWFTNLIPISNNRVAASATSRSTYWCCGSGRTYNAYYHYDAIFMILDSMGNILKDTVYGRRYSNGGNIFPDRQGGYMQYGWIDTIIDEGTPDDIVNFPFYIAHLDTNFKMDWQIDLDVDFFNGRRGPWQIKQLQDGNFIALGDQSIYGEPFTIGWAMKVTRTGEVLWQHSYFSDSNNFAYIRDMVEKSDGSLVFIGKSFNDTLPAWHAMGDLWLIGTDSNGCELPGCGNGLFPASVISPQLPAASLRVYPNPTTGRLTISAPEQGMFIVYDLQGQQTARYSVIKGETEIVLPGVVSGVYLGRFLGESGYEQVVRVVKE